MMSLGRRRAVGLIQGTGPTWAARRKSIAAADPPPFYSHGGRSTHVTHRNARSIGTNRDGGRVLPSTSPLCGARCCC